MNEQPGNQEQQTSSVNVAGRTVDMISETVQQLIATADVTATFGEPVTVGDRTIITAADVMCGVGFGAGSGEGPAQGGGTGSGSGGGGGGGSRSRPVAAIVIEPAGVRVEPIIDFTQLGLAALTAGVFSLFWIMRALRTVSPPDEKNEVRAVQNVAKLLRGR
ncbi:MAG: GerW family sporulation protein [Chloroflexota bacterium]|jgi:uncharacterized spore protein YtfJ